MYDDIAIFIHIVKHNSLTAAAKFLEMPRATLTRRLQKLETNLGVQLVLRSTRRLVLTTEGKTYFDAYEGLINEFDQVHQTLSAETYEMSGPLKVLAPTNISLGLLQPMWSSFIKHYPDIQLDVQLNNSNEDILTCKADIALRMGPLEDSLLHQKRLGTLTSHFVAAPSFIHQKGQPEFINDLHHFDLLGDCSGSYWQIQNKSTRERQRIEPHFLTKTNDLCLIHQLAKDGLGIALLPDCETQKSVDEGLLVQILPEWQGPSNDLFSVWPSGKLLSSRGKCFREFVLEYMEMKLKLYH